MKIFKLSEVESLAIAKWGSMEKLETEQEKRRQQTSELENRKEEEKRHFWDCKELFEPLKHFMVNMELPTERVSSYFKDKGDNRQGELINTHWEKNLQLFDQAISIATHTLGRLWEVLGIQMGREVLKNKVFKVNYEN